MRTIHHITLLSTAALLAVAVPTAGAALSKKAYFDVQINAAQSVSWHEDVTVHGCGGSTTEITGRGSSVLRTQNAKKPWLIAQRVSNPALATLQFAGRPGGTKAAGTFHREGSVQGTSDGPSSPDCGQSIPASPDCGTVDVPRDAQLYLSYYSRAAWPYHSKPAPKVPSLILTGPYSPEWTAPPFSFCPGINGDDWLGGTFSDGTDPIHSGPVALPLTELFGTQKRIKLVFDQQRTVDLARGSANFIGGTWPQTTTIHWVVRLTRRSGPPPLGAVDV